MIPKDIRYTTQSAYEKIRAYFSKPGAEIAVSELGDCEYLTNEGKKCAVGCLIPAGMYTQEIEGGGWPSAKAVLAQHFGARFEHVFGKVDDDFLCAAQDAHDRQANDLEDSEPTKVGRFLKRLDRLAEEHGLRVAP